MRGLVSRAREEVQYRHYRSISQAISVALESIQIPAIFKTLSYVAQANRENVCLIITRR